MTQLHLDDNPFLERGPIRTPLAFFGRHREIAQALPLLRKGLCVAFVGPLRIGKSSLLAYLTHPDIRQHIGMPAVCVVTLDCGGYKHAAPEAIYAQIVDDIRNQELIDPMLLPPTAEGISYNSFKRVIHMLKNNGLSLIVAFDAFDGLIGNQALHADFFSGLRALASSSHVSYLAASELSLASLQAMQPANNSSPFCSLFVQIRLGLFSNDDAVDLLATLSSAGGTPFSEAMINTLVELAGPHPLLLQLAGFYCYGSAEISNAARALFHEAAADVWKRQWQRLNAEERRVLTFWPILGSSEHGLRQQLLEAGLLRVDADTTIHLSERFSYFACSQVLSGMLQGCGIVLDPQRKIAIRNGRALDLNRSEYRLLVALLECAGEVLSEDQIEQIVWGEAAQGTDRVRNLVRGLRDALGNDSQKIIVNRRGMGYALAL